MTDANDYKVVTYRIKGPDEYEGKEWWEYIEYISDILNELKANGVFAITISYEVCWGDYQPAEYYAMGKMLKTKEELAATQANQQARENKLLEKERKEYERLKKKFEN